MCEWKEFIIHGGNNIKTETAKAVLIKVPGSKFHFWHPRKLVREFGRGGYHTSISYTDDFKFNLFRNGEGKYNKFEKIEEKTLTASEMEALMNEG